jgi:hypothetical protein
MKKILLSISAFLAFGVSQGQVLLSENFDVFPTTWTQINQSAPTGAATWSQGGGTAFTPGGFNGGATSFALVNYTSATGTGTISNWLMTPVINVQNGDVISFYTRTGGDDTGAVYPDRLELRLSSTGAASVAPSTGPTDVGSFTTLALTVNPNLTVTGYPFVWTQYTYTISGLTVATDIKIAFRYFVTNGGTTGDNSNIIGIDALSVDRPLSTENFFKSNFAVFPNPATDVINISNVNGLDITKSTITDVNGRIVKEINSSLNTINVGDLTTGIYFLNVTTTTGNGTTKIVKK